VSVVDTGETFALTSITPLLYVDMLLPYTEYAFTIAAHTEVGYGPSSTAISITTSEEGMATNNTATSILFIHSLLSWAVVPSAPQQLTISTVYGDPTLLSLSWIPPSTPNGEVTNYTVYCEEVPESFGSGSGETEDGIFPESNTTLSVTLPGNKNETLFPDLIPFTYYSCYLSANTSAGEGNFSIRLIARTDESSGY
jgi:hypothetical protein